MSVIAARQGVVTPERVRTVLDQLRDPLAIGLAAATAILVYNFAQPESIAFVAGGAVLLIRVAAGLIMHVPRPPVPPLSLLTDEERVIATLVGRRLTDQEIAAKRGITRKAATKIVSRIQRTLGYATRQDVEAWAGWVGLVDLPPPRERIYDKWYVKMTAMAAMFIGLVSSVYNLVNRFWPEVFLR